MVSGPCNEEGGVRVRRNNVSVFMVLAADNLCVPVDPLELLRQDMGELTERAEHRPPLSGQRGRKRTRKPAASHHHPAACRGRMTRPRPNRSL